MDRYITEHPEFPLPATALAALPRETMMEIFVAQRKLLAELQRLRDENAELRKQRHAGVEVLPNGGVRLENGVYVPPESTPKLGAPWD